MSARVLRIVHVITGLNDGGAEAVLFRLCTYDKAHIHHVISLMDEGKYGSMLQDAGVGVDCLGMPQGSVTLSGLMRLWRLIRQLHPDAVQTWMYHADLIGGGLARLAGVSAVFWGVRHSNLTPGTIKRSTILVARLCGRLSRLVPRRIISCSQKAILSHVSLGYPVDRFEAIPNGYDLEHFTPDQESPARFRSEWKIPAGVPLIGMVARFDPQKDHANLIAALTILIDRGYFFSCALIGTGMDSENHLLARMIADRGLEKNVILLGRRVDISAVMSALDIHVLSSLGEAFPNVLAEAMACGTPCVTTDVGDAALIVGETGWVVPARDASALAGALEDALNSLQDKVAWRVRCNAARTRIWEKFEIGEMIKKYGLLWQSNTTI